VVSVSPSGPALYGMACIKPETLDKPYFIKEGGYSYQWQKMKIN
jgi:hypothetical protein